MNSCSLESLSSRSARVTNQVLYSCILLCTIGLIASLFSYLVPSIADDISYMFSWEPGKGDHVVSSFSDVLNSQNVHYMKWNGRYVAHVIVQYFCGILGKKAFAVCNGLMYICFYLCLAKLCRVSVWDFKRFMLLVLIGMLTFQTTYLIAFQVGYIWMATLSMLFLIWFFNSEIKVSFWHLILVAIFSLIAGNGHEAYNIPICFALIIYWFQNRKQMSVKKYVMMIAFGLGTLSNCLSPGTILRKTLQVNLGFTANILSFFIASTAIYFLLVVLIRYVFTKKDGLRIMLVENSFYWSALFGGILFSFWAGIFSNRQLFGIELMAIILAMRLLKYTKISTLVIILLTLVMMVLYGIEFDKVHFLNQKWEEIQQQYVDSSDGKVYVDLMIPEYPINIPRSSEFYLEMKYFNSSASGDCEWTDKEIVRYLHYKYPGHPNVSILPIAK